MRCRLPLCASNPPFQLLDDDPIIIAAFMVYDAERALEQWHKRPTTRLVASAGHLPPFPWLKRRLPILRYPTIISPRLRLLVVGVSWVGPVRFFEHTCRYIFTLNQSRRATRRCQYFEEPLASVPPATSSFIASTNSAAYPCPSQNRPPH